MDIEDFSQTTWPALKLLSCIWDAYAVGCFSTIFGCYSFNEFIRKKIISTLGKIMHLNGVFTPEFSGVYF
jgi:hypothetical protein